MPKFDPGEFALLRIGVTLKKDERLRLFDGTTVEVLAFIARLPKDTSYKDWGHTDWYEVELWDFSTIWCREISLEKIPPLGSSSELFETLSYTPPDRRIRASVPLSA